MLQTLDSWIGRLLLVDARPDKRADEAERAQRVMSFSLVFSGVRCILQYAVLPFVLPLIGIASDAAVPLMLVINVLAIVAVFYSLRRFWQIRYVHRWQYLAVAVAALLLLTVFVALDIQAILT